MCESVKLDVELKGVQEGYGGMRWNTDETEERSVTERGGEVRRMDDGHCR